MKCQLPALQDVRERDLVRGIGWVEYHLPLVVPPSGLAEQLLVQVAQEGWQYSLFCCSQVRLAAALEGCWVGRIWAEQLVVFAAGRRWPSELFSWLETLPAALIQLISLIFLDHILLYAQRNTSCKRQAYIPFDGQLPLLQALGPYRDRPETILHVS